LTVVGEIDRRQLLQLPCVDFLVVAVLLRPQLVQAAFGVAFDCRNTLHGLLPDGGEGTHHARCCSAHAGERTGEAEEPLLRRHPSVLVVKLGHL